MYNTTAVLKAIEDSTKEPTYMRWPWQAQDISAACGFPPTCGIQHMARIIAKLSGNCSSHVNSHAMDWDKIRHTDCNLRTPSNIVKVSGIVEDTGICLILVTASISIYGGAQFNYWNHAPYSCLTELPVAQRVIDKHILPVRSLASRRAALNGGTNELSVAGYK
ncbi:hypothetical protein BX600DRAFT_437351 [Xylariales sp. PMI_506]|nr:hypothetical protein BX600DRAFT_437351 [Xylariales sp. PMI_506]